MTGRTVSHYEILDKLGSGGMGVVYRARDLKLDRTVALKFLSSDLGMSDRERKRFASEAKASSALDHLNIGIVFDIDETPDGQTFIAMAYYAGETMKQKIASHLPLDQSIGLVIQVARAPKIAALTPVAKPAAWREPVAITAGLAVLLAGGAFFRITSLQHEHQRAAADVIRLTRDGQFASAFIRAKAAGGAIAEDEWAALSSVVTIDTTPSGAEIRWKNYSTPEAGWQPLGRSPLTKVRVPLGVLRVQVAKEGFETFEGVLIKWTGGLHDPAVESNLGHYGEQIRFNLSRPGALPPGMVTVPAGPFGIASGGFVPRPMDAYLIDKYEVTNRQYKEFVDKAGYQNRAWWKQRILQDGRELTWEEAMPKFRDVTNRPGPATWEGGTYPTGQEQYPVRGVSWVVVHHPPQLGEKVPRRLTWQQAHVEPAGGRVRNHIRLAASFEHRERNGVPHQNIHHRILLRKLLQKYGIPHRRCQVTQFAS
jgi:formylglycine-generating enzyme required for sulfatase activity